MKRIIITLAVVLLYSFTASAEKTETVIGEWQEVYDAGYSAGHRHGYNDAYNNYIVIGAPNRGFNQLIKEYGSIHDTPWNRFTRRQKVYLCIYGSPGNKLSEENLEWFTSTFGGGDK